MAGVVPAALEIDLGEVGWKPETRSPFVIRVAAPRLQALFDAADEAHRVYELMLLARPGDLLEYIDVWPLQRPQDLQRRWPAELGDGPMPMDRWERLFNDFWDGDAVDTAWREQRHSKPLSTWLAAVLASVKAQQQALRVGDDVLLRHLAAASDEGRHGFCHLPRADAVRQSREAPFAAEGAPTPFHARLATLLREPTISSVLYHSSDNDYRVLRLLATEQRRRADVGDLAPYEAFRVHAMANGLEVDNGAWGSAIAFQLEGIGPVPDLCVLGNTRLLELWREHADWVPKQAVLCRRPGQLPQGWQLVDSGEGWDLYRPAAQLGV